MMDDFLKQFRDNLENRPDPAFEEKDWRSLERQLGRLAKKPPLAMAWWWALPFLILLLGMNAFVLFEQRKMSEQFREMSGLRDTVYQTRVIYHTDTIYRAEVAREKVAGSSVSGAPVVSFTSTGWRPSTIAPSPFLTPGQPSAGVFLPDGAYTYASLLGRHTGEKGQPSAGAPDEQPANPPNPFYSSSAMAPLSAGSLSFILSDQAAGPEMPLEPVLAKRRKTLLQRVYPLRPKGLGLGINGGGAFPINPTLSRQAGGSGGLQMAVEFSPSIRMWVDASYFKIHIESSRMDEAIGVPVIEPPTDEFIFSKAEVPQPTLQFSAGMQYFFLNDSKWRPFAGLGVGAASLMAHDVIYEFKNPVTGEEWNFDGSVPGGSWQTGFVFFQGGLEHEFSRQWRGQLGAGYRTHWNNTGSLSSRILGIRGGLLYKF